MLGVSEMILLQVPPCTHSYTANLTVLVIALNPHNSLVSIMLLPKTINVFCLLKIGNVFKKLIFVKAIAIYQNHGTNLTMQIH